MDAPDPAPQRRLGRLDGLACVVIPPCLQWRRPWATGCPSPAGAPAEASAYVTRHRRMRPGIIRAAMRPSIKWIRPSASSRHSNGQGTRPRQIGAWWPRLVAATGGPLHGRGSAGARPARAGEHRPGHGLPRPGIAHGPARRGAARSAERLPRVRRVRPERTPPPPGLLCLRAERGRRRRRAGPAGGRDRAAQRIPDRDAIAWSCFGIVPGLCAGASASARRRFSEREVQEHEPIAPAGIVLARVGPGRRRARSGCWPAVRRRMASNGHLGREDRRRGRRELLRRPRVQSRRRSGVGDEHPERPQRRPAHVREQPQNASRSPTRRSSSRTGSATTPSWTTWSAPRRAPTAR
jgi:hypothetical protein